MHHPTGAHPHDRPVDHGHQLDPTGLPLPLVDRLTAQKGIKITYNKIDGANHFFDKHEADVVETVKEYVSNMMSKPREGR